MLACDFCGDDTDREAVGAVQLTMSSWHGVPRTSFRLCGACAGKVHVALDEVQLRMGAEFRESILTSVRFALYHWGEELGHGTLQALYNRLNPE